MASPGARKQTHKRHKSEDRIKREDSSKSACSSNPTPKLMDSSSNWDCLSKFPWLNSQTLGGCAVASGVF